METTSYIYGLFDPAEQVIRYVGQSIRPGMRLAGHLSLNPLTGARAVKAWVAEMEQRNSYPCMIILEICDFESAHIKEAEWHKRISSSGGELINSLQHVHRTNQQRSSRKYTERFLYQEHCILEPSFRYVMYYPTEASAQKKFSKILSATATYRKESASWQKNIAVANI